ncbi:ADP-ribosylglycohydrolase family protein [Undibacterium cyanobacteriorum]|uniref:ADP-ribosylglycohydrolase family protein n=1 Tax=Undibacterium cyanobacteriorum TaxID=3073561 RepID=A0ABY9RKK0_9BURK|nr:ADP-ribosylglycohydrolase family protein [Undibacterium sp. 20NA77.5]WMW80877.1 ADP-ribosylglycohydrolase family protein [Undibacterium sp. 20NA77.5]
MTQREPIERHHQILREQYLGCVQGLALGDVLGAPYEGGPLERALWWCLGKTKQGLPRWTDDTQMSINLLESLLDLQGIDQEDLAQRFALSYHWTRGYGPSAAKLLKRIRKGQAWQSASRAIHPQGSFGNGAAMRAPVLALFYPQDRVQLIQATERSAVVTHAHPLAIAGATIISLATQDMLHRRNLEEILANTLSFCRESGAQAFVKKLEAARTLLVKQGEVKAPDIRRQLGNGITAVDSCLTALYLALRFRDAPFMEMIECAIKLGGDTDTISTMAGALWGAYNGDESLPPLDFEEKGHLHQLALAVFERMQTKIDAQLASC